MTTHASLTVTPLKPATPPGDGAWLWDVTAVESISGVARAVGRVTCAGAAVTRRARELTAQQIPELTIIAIIVEPLPAVQ